MKPFDDFSLDDTTRANGSIVLHCKQGGNEWLRARKRIPTSSSFHHIVTSKGEPTKSDARKTYMYQLIAEHLTIRAQDTFVTHAMERGTKLEPFARDYYTAETKAKVQEVGFIFEPQRRWGCSPDGLVGDDGGIEIKCPMRPAMIKHLLGGKVPTCYLTQIQANMWISGAAWWDFILYTDEWVEPQMIRRVEADTELHAKFAEHIEAFCDEVSAAVQRVKEMGA